MSQYDLRIRTRLANANKRIRKIQSDATEDLIGSRVKTRSAQRGPHSSRRWKAGAEFKVTGVFIEGQRQHDISLWLSRVDDVHLSFELAVWLNEVEFLPKAKS